MKDFDIPVIIGVIFDVKTNHIQNGVRVMDTLKQSLLKCVLERNDLAKIYVAHHDWKNIPRDQGESTYYVISYNESNLFSIDGYFKHAINLVGEHQEDCKKYIFLFTDRFQAPKNFHYRKGFLNNDVRGFDNKIYVFGIGNDYDSVSLKNLVQDYEANFIQVDEIQNLDDELLKIMEQ
jgi:hypothetical protein